MLCPDGTLALHLEDFGKRQIEKMGRRAVVFEAAHKAAHSML